MSEPNWVDKTIWTGDNLPIMRGMNSESVDLIYLDPPFNSNANYAAPIGSQAAGAEFKDTWTLQDVDVAWLDLIVLKHPRLHRVIRAAMSDSDQSYLIYMATRLLEMHRILKPTGSIYLHCDPTMSHYLKLVMDSVWGAQEFQNEIIWRYRRWPAKQKRFQRMHDTIFWYTKAQSKNTPWHQQYEDLAKSTRETWGDKQQVADFSEGYRKPSQTNKKSPGAPMADVWEIGVIAPIAKERTGYPTQKPLALLKRIIKASSDINSIVFDPFCGCATTLVAADRLRRQWVGIDISPKAAELVNKRIKEEQKSLFEDITHRTDIPQRTDIGKLPQYNCAANKKQLYGEQSGNCNGCNEHFQVRHLEVDHIIAKTSGGTDHIDNLQLLCSNCNRIKGDRGQEYLLSRLNA